MAIRVKSNNRETWARCLLDPGSQRSYLTISVAQRLKLRPTRTERVSHGLFGGIVTEPVKQNVHSVRLENVERNYQFPVELVEQNKICGEVPLLSQTEVENLLYNDDVRVAHHEEAPAEIEILLGADVVGHILPGVIKETKSGLFAVQTHLGWTVMGRSKVEGLRSSVLVTCSLLLRDLKTTELWSLEALGIRDPIETEKAKDGHEELMKRFQETIKINSEGRYQVDIPFRDNHVELSDYKAVAWKRHQYMTSRLTKNGLLAEYRAVFENWESLKMIEEVPRSELDRMACYLPHRPVVKPNSTTTKIRPMFDASVRGKGQGSLNDCIEKGVNMIELIPDILDRFREKEVGISADIEKAFLQLEVNPRHRDFLRFFNTDGRIYRHCRIVFGVTASPFLLGAVLNYHFKRMEPEYDSTVGVLQRSFYVDNLITSVDSQEELEKLRTEAVEVMGRACMNLREWTSNVETAAAGGARSVLVLGLSWNLDRDTLSCVPREQTNSDQKLTKRRMLSIVHQIYDPLGLICPSLIEPKKLLKEAWIRSLAWDEPLHEDIERKFLKWVKPISIIKEIEIPRRMIYGNNCHLHVFADASAEAYAACIFARSVIGSDARIGLVRAKARLMPKGQFAIARAELMACVIAARLLDSVVKALASWEFEFTCWSDSTTALWWIKQEGPREVFIKNRVREIRRITEPSRWKHVPGEENPADLLSRGCNLIQLRKSEWWIGPHWLYKGEKEWPVGIEIIPTVVCSRVDSAVDNTRAERSNPFEALVKISNFHKVIRIIAWILRFIRRCQSKAATGDNVMANRGKVAVVPVEAVLSCQEIVNAERELWRQVQWQAFESKGKKYPLVVERDAHGIARVRLRITTREDSEAFLSPTLLPGKHAMVKKLVEATHVGNSHANFGMVWTILRQHYWITGARKIIKRIIYDCPVCMRLTRQVMQAPPVALPLDRVRDCAVFETTGVDLAGPLLVKNGSKVWIVLYTCAVYRAVHLDLVASLSAEAFL